MTAAAVCQCAWGDGRQCAGVDEYYDDCDVVESCRCQRPQKIKIVVRRPLFASGKHTFAAAAPQGYAVPSVAAVMVPTFAVPATPAIAASASPAYGGLSQDDIRRLAEELRRQNSASAAAAAASPACAPAAAAAGAADLTCTDPCGDIRQLKKDVAELIALTNRLAVQVNTLSKDYKERHADK